MFKKFILFSLLFFFFKRATQDKISVVQGHWHSKSYVHFFVGKQDVSFAMQVGCGIDDKAYAFNYGRHFAKSHINVGVILEDGTAFLKYMQL